MVFMSLWIYYALLVCFLGDVSEKDTVKRKQVQPNVLCMVFQEFLKSDPYRLHRTAFNACAAEAR